MPPKTSDNDFSRKKRPTKSNIFDVEGLLINLPFFDYSIFKVDMSNLGLDPNLFSPFYSMKDIRIFILSLYPSKAFSRACKQTDKSK